MKNIVFIILTFCTLFVVVSDNYFKNKIPEYEKELIELDNIEKKASKIVETSHFVKKNILNRIGDFQTLNQATKNLMRLEEKLRTSFNTTLENLDKSKKGQVSISLSSKLYRDDTKNLLALFKTNVDNGFLKINSLEVSSLYVTTKFDLIKFYKESK